MKLQYRPGTLAILLLGVGVPRPAMAIVAPRALVATALSSSSIRLTWKDVSVREVGFAIERSLAAQSGFVEIATAGKNVQTYQDNGRAPGTYFYRIRAKGKWGMSAYSNVAAATTGAVGLPTPTPAPTKTPTPAPTSTAAATPTPGATADVLPPSAPANVTAQAASCNQVNTTWKASTDSGGSGLQSYNVYRDGTFDRQVMAPSTSMSDTGLAPSTVYSYAVAAKDNAGNVSAMSALAMTNTPACAGVTPWARRFGGTATEAGWVVAVDASGNLLVSGIFKGTVNLGGAALTSAGSYDVFVAKYTASGAHLWSKRFGGPGDDLVHGIAVDGHGDLVLTGEFRGTADFGGGTFTSPGATGRDGFLVALRGSDGGHRWSKQLGSTGDDAAYGVAIDGLDDVVVTGTFQGAVDFGGGARSSTWNWYDVFLAKYTSLGQHVWSRDVWGSSTDRGLGVALDGAGDVVVTGVTTDQIDFGGGRLVPSGFADVFVAKLSGGDGSHVWSKLFGTADDDLVNSVAVDTHGNVILTGSSRSRLDLGGGRLDQPGAYLVKLSASGQHLWSRGFGGWSNEGRGVAVDTSDNVVVTGVFAGTTNFGGAPLTSLSTSSNIFVAKYTPSGGHVWSQRVGGTTGDLSQGVAIGGNGAIVVTGAQSGSGTYLGTPLTSAGGYDFLLLNLAP